MKFKDLPIGAWFSFPTMASYNGSPQGPFRKTGARTYIYHHPHGWFETRIGTVSLDTIDRERPDDAPDELMDIHVNFNEESDAWYFNVQKYKVRDGESVDCNDSFSEGWCDADNFGKHIAMMDAIARAKDYAVAHAKGAVQAQMVVIFVEGDEYLIVTPRNGKASVTAGIGNPRHSLNRKRPA
jgi:hypothetical protein